jgi:hypothetical protein
MEKTGTTSCQVAVPTTAWLRFRQLCLIEGVSASTKVRQLIVAAVLSQTPEILQNVSADSELKGVEDERRQEDSN